MSDPSMADPAALYRMQVGEFVKARLLTTPNAMQIPANGLDVFVVRDFLSPDLCREVMARIDEDRVPSGLLAPTEDPEFRTSESCNLRPQDPVNKKVEAKINALLGIQPAHGETIQGQRYDVGQQFKPHHDFFHTTEAYWAEQQNQGGQRTWTAMIFLNQPERGGMTFFPDANVRVTPRAGNLLAWNNMDAFGHPNPKSLHTGMPVEAGIKYVITKWYRERPWSWWTTGQANQTVYY